MTKVAIVLLLASLAAGTAVANDSTAELATGGLVFVQNDDVEMRSEDLYISAAEIRVRYRFFNRTGKEVSVHVAFPMPEVTIESSDQNISLPTDDPVNLLAFRTGVNGRAVETQVEQRVTAGGADRTAYLRALGVPLAPHLQSTNAALDRLPRDKREEIVRLGLAEVETFDTGKGMEEHLSARWSLQTTFYWQQTFPAQKETVIEHRYKPSVGMSVAAGIGEPQARQKYCIEPDIVRTVQRATRAANMQFPPFSEERIDYILTTGANWSGPIRDFRLVVDKGDPSHLVSFCGEGVRKIGPTQFEMRRTNFTPTGNLSVVILKRIPLQ
jgi:hypothetical protein